ncbi:MAG: preprotein translocase subunit YajC [Faecalibacterium sp.]|nr:preprotein translocase subunit YajC [Ruminococcus sp.]MCM1484717.1 preprotein translocase subunit YajC [Faecalibacterium sp.]
MSINLLTAGSSGAGASGTSMILLMVAMFAIMYFVMIRPQKKRQKEEQAMRDAVDVGDEITTIGGICGRVVTVKENHLIIETGSDRTRMQIMKWAVQTNNTANERLQEERAQAKEAAEKARAEKKEKKSRKSKENND